MDKDGKQLKCRPRGKPWPPGVSGNSKGRPPGAINRLSQAVRGNTLAINSQTQPVFDETRPFTIVVMEGLPSYFSQDGFFFDRLDLKYAGPAFGPTLAHPLVRGG